MCVCVCVCVVAEEKPGVCVGLNGESSGTLSVVHLYEHFSFNLLTSDVFQDLFLHSGLLISVTKYTADLR